LDKAICSINKKEQEIGTSKIIDFGGINDQIGIVHFLFVKESFGSAEILQSGVGECDPHLGLFHTNGQISHYAELCHLGLIEDIWKKEFK